MRLLAIAFCVALLSSCSACDVPRQVCPGTIQGTLRFHGIASAPVDGKSRCAFSQQTPAATVDFTATVTFVGGANGANLCVDNPSAQPIGGTHEGDKIYVSSIADSTITDCACNVKIEQVVSGTLLRDPDGGANGPATGFAGELLNVVRAAGSVDDGGSGAPDGGGDGGADDGGGGADAGPDAGAADGGASGACGCGLPCEVHYDLAGTK